jgi:hypothetical protein
VEAPGCRTATFCLPLRHRDDLPKLLLNATTPSLISLPRLLLSFSLELSLPRNHLQVPSLPAMAVAWRRRSALPRAPPRFLEAPPSLPLHSCPRNRAGLPSVAAAHHRFPTGTEVRRRLIRRPSVTPGPAGLAGVLRVSSAPFPPTSPLPGAPVPPPVVAGRRAVRACGHDRTG